MKSISIGFAVVVALAALPLSAHETGNSEKPPIGVGFTLYGLDQGYDMNDVIGAGQIYIEYHGEKLDVDYDHISYSLYKNENMTVDVLGKNRVQGYESDDDRLFEGMEDRDPALELGGKLSLHNSVGRISLELLADPDTAHEGTVVTLEVDKSFIANGWTFKPAAGVTWQSDEVTDYYYGVRDSEVTANRAAFKGDSAVIPHAGLDVTTGLGEDWKAGLNMNYQYLPDEITDSPLVDDEHAFTASARLSYFF